MIVLVSFAGTSFLLSLRFLQHFVEAIHQRIPDASIRLHPGGELLECLWAQAIEPVLGHEADDEAGFVEDAKVLRQLRLAELEPEHDLPHGLGSLL
jgi:hypothetical protein